MISAKQPKQQPPNLVDTRQTMAAGVFKAKCLKVLDQVAETREPVVVTKHGKPVARLVPIAEPAAAFGALQGSILWEGDVLSPVDVEWEANR